MKYPSILTLLLLAIAGGYIFLKERDTRLDNQFVVGTAAGYAPFVSINPQGEYEGFDIEVATALAAHMGKKLILKDLGSMTSLFAALDQGKIDAIMWGLSITQDRLKKVAMVRYQGELCTTYPLIFWKQLPENVHSLADMQGKIICVEPHSSQDAVLRKYANINPLPVEKIDDALLNIQYSKADAAFVEPAIANKFKKRYPEIQMLQVPLEPEDQVEGIGIVIGRDNASLITHVQDAVAALQSQGIIKKLEEKWGIT